MCPDISGNVVTLLKPNIIFYLQKICKCKEIKYIELKQIFCPLEVELLMAFLLFSRNENQ